MITNRCLCTIPIFATVLALPLNDSRAAIQTEIMSGPTSLGASADTLLSPEPVAMNAAVPVRIATSMQSDLRWYLVDTAPQIQLVEPVVRSADELRAVPYATSARGEALADVVADLYLAHVPVQPSASSATLAAAPKNAAPALNRTNADTSMISNAYAFDSRVTPDGSNSRAWKPVKVYSLPEVSSLTLLAIGSVGLIMRRRKHT